MTTDQSSAGSGMQSENAGVSNQQALAAAIDSYQSGAIEKATELCGALLARDPRNVRAHNLFGVLMERASRWADAESSYRQAAESDPTNALAYCNLGNLLTQRGAFEEAIPHFQEALQIDPKDAEAHNGLGFALLATGKPEDAMECFDEAIQIEPQHAEAYVNLGKAQLEQDRFLDAENCFKQALSVAPDSERAALSLGDVLARQRRLADTLSVYDQILDIRPESLRARQAKVETLVAMNRFDEAYAMVRETVNGAAPFSTGMVGLYGELAALKGDRASAIDLLTRMLAQPGQIDRSRRALNFALGDLLDGTGAYGDAFEHYRQGNALKHPASIAMTTDPSIERIRTYFSRERLAALPRASNRSALPVFIVGMARSGKSLVENILADHPDVFIADETKGVLRAARSLGADFSGDADQAERSPKLDPVSLNATAGRHLDRLQEIAGGAQRLTNTLPYNFKHLGLISLLFPGARIIHCSRDAMDTCLSCYFKNFEVGYAYDDLRQIGMYYRQYARLMSHWTEVLDVPMMEIRYEELVAEPDRTRHALLAFLDLDGASPGLQSPDTPPAATVPGADNGAPAMHTDFVGRWRHYEPHVSPLTKALSETN